jgi:hypothetical protein
MTQLCRISQSCENAEVLLVQLYSSLPVDVVMSIVEKSGRTSSYFTTSSITKTSSITLGASR